MKKTTIYIDIDDDIAGIAEKIQNADQKIVALVLPKRPSVLQGSVNMNLLKRTSDDASKNIVLITSDEQVMRLAGQTGIHVSTSLQSKPVIPEVGGDVAPAIDVVSDSGIGADDLAQPDVFMDDKKLDLSTPIGSLTGTVSDDEIDLSKEADDDVVVGDAEKSTQDKKGKKISVPNFNSFRSKASIGLLLVALLVGGGYWALYLAPKASIVVTTEKTDSNAKITITASKDQKTVDAEKGLLPAVRKEDTQKLNGTFTATGQKDAGTPAQGTVSFKNCESLTPVSIPKGTGVSKGDVTFITQEDYTIPGATLGPSLVCNSVYTGAVKVTANKPGGQYNYPQDAQYTISADFGNVTVLGDAMGGGTTKMVKVVSNEDVELAKSKVLEKASSDVKTKVAASLASDGLVPITETFTSVVGTPVPSVAVDAEATSDVALSIEIKSTMLGFKRSDVDPLLTKEILKAINSATQKIYTTGSEQAILGVTERPSADVVKMTVAVTAKIGPNIDQAQLKKDIAGKKAGEAKLTLESLPGVSKVDIKLSPFWVFSIPKNTEKTSLVIYE